MDEQGSQQQHWQYLTYCWSVFARAGEGVAWVGSVGGRLAGDGDGRWPTALAGGPEGSSVENI